MKKFIIFTLLILAFIFDFLFFDIDFSDIMYFEKSTQESIKNLRRNIETTEEVFFVKNGIRLKSCEDLELYNFEAVNPYEMHLLNVYNTKCSLLKVLENVRRIRKSYIRYTEITDFDVVPTELFFKHTFDKKNNSKYKTYFNKDIRQLLQENKIKIDIIHKSEINVYNEITGTFLHIKEVARGDVNQLGIQEMVLEISVSILHSKHIRYTVYEEYTRFNNTEMLQNSKNYK